MGLGYAQRLGFSPLKLLAPVVLIGALAGSIAYEVNPKFAQRVNLSAAALDFIYVGLETASSERMHLWSNALKVMGGHPINDAGARAFRYAYPQFAKPGDIFISPDGMGAIYAHQLLLEVGSETGIIGLAGMLAFSVIFIRTGRGLPHHQLAWAAWLGAFAWLFPINTHTVLYSAYWSLLIGWLLAVLSARPSKREEGVNEHGC